MPETPPPAAAVVETRPVGASVPAPRPLGDFALSGRFAARAGENGVSGQVRWERHAHTDRLVFSAPMTGAVGELFRDAGQVVWTDADGKRSLLPAAGSDIETGLGFSIPVDALSWWLAGLPATAQPVRLERDATGRIVRLDETGWQVEYARYARIGERWLAGKMTLRRGDDLELRLVTDAWELPGNSPEGPP